ncbi:dihydrolipoamide acetyltransferase family protein [Sulfurimonas xiamenensis]|jgi:pyruvate dehydrogenase E2 component (dihydrolipoamide acetyltransferase)|uniref:Dihydrolipoamide acetyltransferase component of pyruvate dehydrogenase complex n=1 Tax=Sulfurimonas xiamenensis TaxID=2590021 RepID=A0AAJ4DMS6_9BACT|nr:dihydrolipoamide acetyltransferase family protein [Sulfurimonas xiamenensis]QFR43345.1 2-oxo acid dehydrogenase subunit E2 [Sulfurimonas xiamenensis]
MSTFVMPSLGADMESAVLMEWKVKEGESVSKGDIIAEVETSKGVIEIEVFEDGVIEKLLVKEETDCAVGTPLAVIRSKEQEVEEKESQEFKIDESPQKVLEPEEKKTDEKVFKQRIKISPAARKKAKELGVELSEVQGDKKEIHLRDIESETVPKKSEHPASGMRQAIAKAMSLSNAQIPHYYLSSSINMSPALKWLEEVNRNRAIQERILPAALLIQAVVYALKEVPQLNGFWRNDALEISKEINPGIAIALRKEGLITPAILNAHELNLDGTMKSLSNLIERTRSGKLRNSEITEQTITITNLGDLGAESVFGVIYPPQVALVGFGRIMNAPWAEGDTLSVRKVLQATIAGDHRATDGRIGGKFLDKLNQILQIPQELL